MWIESTITHHYMTIWSIGALLVTLATFQMMSSRRRGWSSIGMFGVWVCWIDGHHRRGGCQFMRGWVRAETDRHCVEEEQEVGVSGKCLCPAAMISRLRSSGAAAVVRAVATTGEAMVVETVEDISMASPRVMCLTDLEEAELVFQ
jgi:hypothetical protein